MLARNAEGTQEYRFSQGSTVIPEDVIIPVAEGGVEVTVNMIPDPIEQMLNVTYFVTDAAKTHSGEFAVGSRSSSSPDKWVTLFSMSDGMGVIDYVEIHNQDIPSGCRPGDVDCDGLVNLDDFNTISGNFGLTDGQREDGDLNRSKDVELRDFRQWKANVDPLSAAAAQPVPEPGTIALMAIAGLVIAARRGSVGSAVRTTNVRQRT